jgi:Ca2+-binding RTX toxin-like protein
VAARRRRATLRRRPALLAPIALGAAFLVLVAVTATNAVPATRAGRQQAAITPNTLKPSACSGITVTALRVGSGTFNGTAAAELVLGSAGVDTINGAGRNDCIVGGAGNDVIRGGAGTDVCIGGPGMDTFPAACETQIQ